MTSSKSMKEVNETCQVMLPPREITQKVMSPSSNDTAPRVLPPSETMPEMLPPSEKGFQVPYPVDVSNTSVSSSNTSTSRKKAVVKRQENEPLKWDLRSRVKRSLKSVTETAAQSLMSTQRKRSLAPNERRVSKTKKEISKISE